MTFPDSTLDLTIEMAFQPASTAPEDRVWTDVSDRLLAQGITINKGRSDEASQTRPSSVSFGLDNGDGALTPSNAASPYHPNVHRGIPVRVSVEATRSALVLPGEVGAFASTPDAADLDITGDLDLRIRVQPDRWAVAPAPIFTVQRLVNKWAAGDLSYGFGFYGAGALVADWSTDGVAGSVAVGSALVSALRPVWLAQAIDVDDGAGGHTVTWYRFEGETAPASLSGWELVQTITGAGTTSIHPGAGELEIGSRGSGLHASFQGSILAVEVRDGIDGAVVANPDFSAQPAGTTSFTDAAGKTWTIHGAAEISARATRFVGTVDALSLEWPYGDHNAAGSEPSEARVSFTAAGILRRLSQGEKSLRSALYRHITSAANADGLLGYWSCEDDDRAVHLAPGLPDSTEVVSINDIIDTAADDSLLGGAALPSIPSGEVGEWTASVPAGTDTDWAAELFFRIPTLETSPTRTQLLELTTTNTAARWVVGISATDIRIQAFNGGGVTLVDSVIGSSGLADTWAIARLEATQNGGNIDWTLATINVDTGLVSTANASIAGTNGRVITLSNSTTGPPGGMSFGHIVVHDRSKAIGWLAGADTAWVGESAAHRFWRLCTEEGIEAEVIGDPTANQGLRGDLAFSEPMGPQGRDSLLKLIRECVNLDSGFLLERRRSPGLVFRNRQSLEAQDVGLALDAAVPGELDHPFVPVLDDQRLRNDITVSSRGGSSARALDQVSIDTEGSYEVEVALAGVGGLKIQNAILADQTGLTEFVAGQNLYQAERRLNLAASTDIRYPKVGFDLGSAPQRITDWVDLELGDRVTVTNLPAQHPTAEVELLLEHVGERLTNRHWRPLLTCSPGTHWLSPWPPLTASPTGPLSVTATSSAVGVDPQAVTNPIQGAGGTLLAIAVATGPSNEAIPPAAWVAPPGATEVFDYGGVDFVPRAKAWTFTEDGAGSYTFGFDTAGGNACTCVLVGLDGVAGNVEVTGTPVVAGGSTSTPYPSLATQVDDLVLAAGISQITDEMTAGPSGYTEEFNNTDTQSPRGLAVHSTMAVGALTTPGNSTWDGSVGGHIQFVLGFRGSGSGGTGNQPLAAAEWTVYVDPEDPDSFNENRTDGQLITAGNRWNVGDTTDGIQAGTGYGLSFDAFDEIHSFSMEDGDTLRLGARSVAGLFHTAAAFVTKHQFRNADGYVYQSGQENFSTTFPGTDRLFHDGTRTQLALIPDSALGGGNAANDPKAIRASFGGETGDRVLQASVFRIEEWMLANDLNVAGGGVHASGDAQSPWSHFFGQGKFEVIVRTTDSGLAWPSSGPTPWTGAAEHSEAITATDVGDWWGLISDYTIDPIDGHLHVWLAKGSSGFSKVVDLNNGYGLSYADTDPNQDLWYPLLANFYSWHNDQANATNNWDDTYGNVRTMAYAFAGVVVAPTTQTVADLESHCNYFLEG